MNMWEAHKIHWIQDYDTLFLLADMKQYIVSKQSIPK